MRQLTNYFVYDLPSWLSCLRQQNVLGHLCIFPTQRFKKRCLDFQIAPGGYPSSFSCLVRSIVRVQVFHNEPSYIRSSCYVCRLSAWMANSKMDSNLQMIFWRLLSVCVWRNDLKHSLKLLVPVVNHCCLFTRYVNHSWYPFNSIIMCCSFASLSSATENIPVFQILRHFNCSF